MAPPAGRRDAGVGAAVSALLALSGVTRAFGGLMLIVVGLLMVTGLWENVITWLQINLIATFQVVL